MTRRTWVADLWDPDDPSIRRTNESVAAAIASRTARDAPQATEPAEVASASAEPDPEPPAESSRRARIADALRRVRAGDSSAVAVLRELLQ